MKVLINGALGKMGKKVYEACLENDVTPLCGVDIKEVISDTFPVYDDYSKVKEVPNVIIDFSSPVCLDNVLNYAIKNNVPCVLCSTGYTKEQISKIDEASKKIAIFRSANMSLGVNVLISIVKEAAKKLGGFDIEIIEKHHNEKKDSPSGTALMLADGIKEALPEKYYIYGREGIVGKRTKDEICLHAVRGGNIVGEHDVIFAGIDETITLSHQATDRKVFANGAVKAGKFLVNQKAGLYNMDDLLKC